MAWKFSGKSDVWYATNIEIYNYVEAYKSLIFNAEGNKVSADEQVMTSKAGIFDKIIAFFKKLLGLTKTILQDYKA